VKAAFATRASRWLPLVLTVVLGLSASAAGALLFYDGESERLYLSLDHRAGWRAKDLEVKLRMTGGPVGGFATFISTELTEGVTPDPEKFARWAQIRSNYIETVPRAYFWWPYLPGRDAGAPATSGISGDPGFQVPLRYLPGETDSRPGGLDPDEGVQATIRETLVRAWFGGGVRLSRPYRGRDGAGEEVTEVLFAAPVYEGGKVPPTIGDRQAKIAGIVGGAFSLRDMLDKAIKGTPGTPEAIYIAEQPWSRDEPGQYFARYDPAVGHFLMEKGTVRPGDLAGLAIAKPLQGPGIDFYLLFEYLPAEIRSNRTPGPWLFLFSGLALTSAAAGYVQRSLRRRDALTAAVSVSDARLRRTHRELEAVVQSSPAAIVCTDRRGVVTVWNMAAEQLFGIPALDAVGSAYRPSPASSDTDMSDLGRAIAEGRLIDGTASLVTANGSRRDVSVRSASLTGETGELPGMIYMASDVTDMLLLEDQLRQAQKMEAVGQLTGGVAHDFNNLLAVIIGNLDLVGSAFDAGSRNAKLLDGALRAALRGADLTRALLAFALRQPL
jgi:PAS domain S-box-containing protein